VSCNIQLSLSTKYSMDSASAAVVAVTSARAQLKRVYDLSMSSFTPTATVASGVEPRVHTPQDDTIAAEVGRRALARDIA
jgi:hypothetical protein